MTIRLAGGTVVDGTGAAPYVADVLIDGDRIAAVAPSIQRGDDVIDIGGRYVCPGFVDIAGHSDSSVLVDGALFSHLAQGVTTQVSGVCGYSYVPRSPRNNWAVRADDPTAPSPANFADYFSVIENIALGPNVGYLVGHGVLRGAVMGYRAGAPSRDEMARMSRLLDEALDAGAMGLSSGLAYRPGLYAKPEEILTLAGRVAARGSLYASCLRDESGGLLDALAEAVDVARELPNLRLEISHLKVQTRALPGGIGAALGMLDDARSGGLDAAFDHYPYTFTATGLLASLPPSLLTGTDEELLAALGTVAFRRAFRASVLANEETWENPGRDPGWSKVRVTFFPPDPSVEGSSIEALAAGRNDYPEYVVCDILRESQLGASMAVESVAEDDVIELAKVGWGSIATDSEGVRPAHPILGLGKPHPRTYGAYPRLLERFVRDLAVVSWGQAIRKMSSVPARRLGLRRRGEVRAGWFADLVVIDPLTVAATATSADPHRPASGIDLVIVNGKIALRDGAETGTHGGRLIRAEA